MVRWSATARRAPALSAFFVCAVIASLPLLAACGGGSATGKTVPTAAKPGSTVTVAANLTPNDAKTAPTLTMPVSRFVASLDDLGTDFITNVPDTFVLTADIYGKTNTFGGQDGPAMLRSWGYLGGYETSFRPECNDTTDKCVLSGAFYIYIEAHLLSSADNAQKMYQYFDSKIKAIGATPVDVPAIGNTSEGWKLPQGQITSTVQAIDHRVMFRRGNLVVVVRTLGAESLMTIDSARAVAAIIDGKALGTIPAVEPTPTGNFTPNAGQPAASPTAKK